MAGRIKAVFNKLFQPRDELSFSNVRLSYWPVLLFVLFGLGWLITAFLPKNYIIPTLRLAALFSASIVLFLTFMPLIYRFLQPYIFCKACFIMQIFI